MSITNSEKALILSRALPHIQKYSGKIIVVKYGGNAMTSEDLKQAVMEDISLLSLIGVKVVLVHGGGPEISKTLEALQMETHFVNGLRYTNAETARVVQMVMAGSINKDLVYQLNRCGGKAIGICGLDGSLLTAQKIESEEDLGFVGDITKVNGKVIHELIEQGYIPVVATVAGDDEGNVYNINADTAAAHIAAELNAENLSLLTDIRGLLEDTQDENSLIPHVNINDVPALIEQGIISGGMIPKINGCVQSIRKGVKKAFIIDGRVPHALLIELLTDEGLGTMFTGQRNGKGDSYGF